MLVAQTPDICFRIAIDSLNGTVSGMARHMSKLSWADYNVGLCDSIVSETIKFRRDFMVFHEHFAIGATDLISYPISVVTEYLSIPLFII